MTAPDDPHLDRLLSEGRPSGPALDRVWARVSADLESEAAASSTTSAEAKATGWRRWWPGLAAGAVPAALVAALLVWPVTEPSAGSSGFSMRSAAGADVGPAVLEATCGSAGAPCPVGAPLFLRLQVSDVPGTASLFLESSLEAPSGAREKLWGPVDVEAGTRALPLEILPEPGDVEAGITLVLVFFPRPGEPVERRLRLRVAP